MVHPHLYRAGAVYYVDDELLGLPGGERVVHDGRRPAVVVSDQGGVHGTNAQRPEDWPSVLVVPISSKTSYRTKFDVPIAAGEANLRKKGWARIPGLQMVDKTYLTDMTGLVDQDTLDQITAQILNYLGILSEQDEEEE